MHAGDKTKVVRFAAAGDDPSAWGNPQDLGETTPATDVAVSPEGVVVTSGDTGLTRLGDGAILPAIDTACGIEFLDATRLAIAAGPCGEDPRLRLADLGSGATRQIPGDRGEHFAFAAAP